MKLWGQPAKGESKDSSIVSAVGSPTERNSEIASELDNLLAKETAQRTKDFLSTRGWCLWQCSTLSREIIAVVRDENVTGVPKDIPVYTEVDLEELCQGDVTETTLRLVHEAKKLAGAKVITEVTGNEG